VFKRLLEEVSGELSGTLAFRRVAELSRFHRVQASPGYRAAAQWAVAEFQAAGVRAELLTYPADDRARYWSCRMFREWTADEAELVLIEPGGERRRLCNFTEDKMSLVQRSGPTPPEGLEAEVVVVDQADRPESYHGVDVKGKVVLVSGDVGLARRLAVDQHGAVGLLVDHLREFPPVRRSLDLPDARQYTTFWPTGAPGERPCFGFVLTTRDGLHLRGLIRGAAQEGLGRGRRRRPSGAAPRVYARVDARFYDGQMENVSAVIPGQTDEEVIVVAHLCHPQPSANDNASGSGTVIEVARTLQALITSGRLAQPRRGIRFLLVPEMTGTYAFLATQEKALGRFVAAINLDMVGENQALCGSPLLIEKPPASIPSFAADLAARILADIGRDAHTLTGPAGYQLFKYVVTDFSGGSDHYVLADPSVGIPCPMLNQWPDRFYHTNEDTIDKVDPEMLRRVGVLTAVYAYFLAAAGYPEALWLASEMASRFPSELHGSISGPLSELIERLRQLKTEAPQGEAPAKALAAGLASLDRKLTYLLDRKLADVESLNRLISPRERAALGEIVAAIEEELVGSVTQQQCRLRWVLRGLSAELRECATEPPPPRQRTAADRKAEKIVPVRVYPGPVWLRGHLENLTAKQRADWWAFERAHQQAANTLTVRALYWVDGRRTLLEVADLTEQETGLRDTEYLLTYFTLLSRMRLLRLAGAGQASGRPSRRNEPS
jgi:hypothetical protein